MVYSDDIVLIIAWSSMVFDSKYINVSRALTYLLFFCILFGSITQTLSIAFFFSLFFRCKIFFDCRKSLFLTQTFCEYHKELLIDNIDNAFFGLQYNIRVYYNIHGEVVQCIDLLINSLCYLIYNFKLQYQMDSVPIVRGWLVHRFNASQRDSNLLAIESMHNGQRGCHHYVWLNTGTQNPINLDRLIAYWDTCV